MAEHALAGIAIEHPQQASGPVGIDLAVDGFDDIEGGDKFAISSAPLGKDAAGAGSSLPAGRDLELAYGGPVAAKRRATISRHSWR
jgi:hypothetical protein